MKRVTLPLVVFTIFLLLCSCSKSKDSILSFKEQYNLGVRYLSEGNYKEAIIAFTEAIKIDSKSVPAYIGLADAYVGSGNIGSAISNFETAIKLDNTTPEAYTKLADAYIKQGDQEKAIEVLQQGYKATGDESLAKKAEELKLTIEANTNSGALSEEQFAFSGTLKENKDVYKEKTDEITSEKCTYNSLGLFFDEPQSIEIKGQTYMVSELNVYYGSDDNLNKSMRNYIGKHITVKGNIILCGEEPELVASVDNETGDSKEIMSYMMNGPLAIQISELSVSD